MDPVYVSTSSKALFTKVRKIVPPLLERFHKGQQGRVAVIGGCVEYVLTCEKRCLFHQTTDLSEAIQELRTFPLWHLQNLDVICHVICERSAATVIKTYSPSLMVHPMLPSSDTVQDPNSIDASALAQPIISMLSRLHTLVIGPGLGRDGVTLKVVTEVIKEAQSKSIPFVLDADGLLLVTDDPGLVKGYRNCILTPNVNEFSRLAKALNIEVQSQAKIQSGGNKTSKESEACEKLSNALGGVTIIQKGPHDIISNGVTTLINDVTGGLKRSGGQGDTLTGSLGTLLAWRAAYHNKLWDSGEKENERIAETKQEVKAELESEDKRMSPTTTLLLAAWAGSGLTRDCSRRAFKAKGRSMQAGDLTDEVYPSFIDLIGEPETPEKSNL